MTILPYLLKPATFYIQPLHVWHRTWQPKDNNPITLKVIIPLRLISMYWKVIQYNSRTLILLFICHSDHSIIQHIQDSIKHFNSIFRLTMAIKHSA